MVPRQIGFFCHATCFSALTQENKHRMIKQAFVLGAGLGTRLRPLTDEMPKPLVPIFQKPLITFAFDHLIDAGITKFFVNTHHQRGKIRRDVPGKNRIAMFRSSFATNRSCSKLVVGSRTWRTR